MTPMSAPTLVLAPNIVKPGASAILAEPPLGSVPRVTCPVGISDRRGGPASQIRNRPSARWTETRRSPLARYYGTMESPLRNHRELQHIMILV